ncbi:MAG: hypothetical protein ABL866_12795 [Devosia sp.]
MPWSSIAFAEGFESPNSAWIRTVFHNLYEHASDEEFDELALYRAKGEAEGVTLYLSPRATARLRAAMSRFDLTDCERPETEAVELVIGAPLAWRTEWCETPLAERLEQAEQAFYHDLELDALMRGEAFGPDEVEPGEVAS